MKNILPAAIVALVFISTASAKTLVNVDNNGVGIKGYDPVAYFTDNKAVKGNAQFQSSSNGVIYNFASAQNKAAFDANPSKYAPQFGGFCAWAGRNCLCPQQLLHPSRRLPRGCGLRTVLFRSRRPADGSNRSRKDRMHNLCSRLNFRP
jgi:YHS domain-containing protein